jgi:hypothetical protein
MTDQEFEAILQNALEAELMVGFEGDDFGDVHIETFEEARVLTKNRGLVVRISDQQFYLEITSR